MTHTKPQMTQFQIDEMQIEKLLLKKVKNKNSTV